MKKIAIVSLTFLSATLSFAVPKKNPSKGLPSSNPFSAPSKLPYQAPDFRKIKDADYKPALEEGMARQLEEIRRIADNPAPPTFENTLVAMEKSGQLLARVQNVFDLVTGANTNPGLQQLKEEMAPKLAANKDAIYLNTTLFKRIETIYNQRSTLKLDAESQWLLDYMYKQFVQAGARLSTEGITALKKLNEEDALLSARFGNQLLNAGKEGALVISDSSELAGLSAADMEAYAGSAKARNMPGKWLIPLLNTTQQPPLQNLSVRATRQKLYEASWNRAEKNDSNDTRQVIVRLADIRAEKAKLLGFKSFAAWKLQDQMAQTPEAVDQFFAQVAPATTAKAKREAAEIQALIDQQNGGFQLEPWDWNYYSEQVRKAKYNLDASETKPYFEINKVLEKGVFYAAQLLFGMTFKERLDLPVYQQDVRVFEVFDKDGKSMALFYSDYFKRDNKSGGAWMSNMVGQSKLLGTKPVIYNVCNFAKPAPGQPALISYEDVTTMFHEFGHALHGLFAAQKYPTLSGTNVARDYVEFPSQFMENWALYPTVLKNYAVHYQTGEPMPQSLVDKIKRSTTFNQGYKFSEAIASSSLDMQWHKLAPGVTVPDVDAFEKSALEGTGLDIAHVPPRYRSTYFLHIWANGYSAGYYAYQWTKMLAADAYSWFDENGGLTRANGQRFRDMILSRGNTADYNKMFKDFRGHAPDIKPLEKVLGLSE